MAWKEGAATVFRFFVFYFEFSPLFSTIFIFWNFQKYGRGGDTFSLFYFFLLIRFSIEIPLYIDDVGGNFKIPYYSRYPSELEITITFENNFITSITSSSQKGGTSAFNASKTIIPHSSL